MIANQTLMPLKCKMRVLSAHPMGKYLVKHQTQKTACAQQKLISSDSTTKVQKNNVYKCHRYTQAPVHNRNPRL